MPGSRFRVRSIAAGACWIETQTVSGTQAHDRVILNPEDTPDPSLDVVAMTPANANDFRVRICNRSASPVDDVAKRYYYVVLR